MAITDLMINDGASVYYTKAFRAVLEDHMTYLREHPLTNPVTVLPGEAFHYEHDLYGYLRSKRVPTELHWIIMRMNNYTNPRTFNRDVTSLLWPDISVISRIQQSNSSANRIT